MAGLVAQDQAADAGGLGEIRSSFAVAGATAYRNDVPDAEVHILEAGHFALDEATDEIASLVRDFLAGWMDTRTARPTVPLGMRPADSSTALNNA